MVEPDQISSGDEFLLNLGAAIRARRLALGFSQDEVATQAGLHRTYLSDIERGTRNITVGILARIAEALHVKVAQLARSAENPKDD